MAGPDTDAWTIGCAITAWISANDAEYVHMTSNSTFKLTDDDLVILGDLADEMKCSRTDVIRRALRQHSDLRRTRRAAAEAFVERVFNELPDGSTLMIGLDSAQVPYAAVDGRDPRPDIEVIGEPFSAGGDDYVRVCLVDPDSDLRLDAGLIKVRTGGWLALMQPFPVELAS